VRDLCGGALPADLRSEVDLELPGGNAGLGELLDADHAADPHVDRLELLPGDAAAVFVAAVYGEADLLD
jgi:hypothetical protein